MIDSKMRQEKLMTMLASIQVRSEKIMSMLTEGFPEYDLIEALNPDVNGTVKDYLMLERTLSEFHRGEIEAVWLTEWHSSSMKLLDKLARRYPAIISLNYCKSAQCSLYSILQFPELTADEMEFHTEIKRKIEVLKRNYRINSDSMQMIIANKDESRPLRKQKKRLTRQQSSSLAKAACDEVLREINRRYEMCGGKRSRMAIVREMRVASAYSARMSGKCDKTWADQASCAKKRTENSLPHNNQEI